MSSMDLTMSSSATPQSGSHPGKFISSATTSSDLSASCSLVSHSTQQLIITWQNDIT
jgi:hypothetical protein